MTTSNVNEKIYKKDLWDNSPKTDPAPSPNRSYEYILLYVHYQKSVIPAETGTGEQRCFRVQDI